MYWSVLGQNWLWIVRLVKSWHFICNIGILSELVNFREIGICIGPRSTDLMFDMCWIDLEVVLWCPPNRPPSRLIAFPP